MAAQIVIGGTDTERVIVGTDWTKAFKVADMDTDPTGSTAKNISAFAMTFDIRRTQNSTTVLVSKTVGSGLTVSGTFNTVLATSTQVVTVAMADTDITAAKFGVNGGTFYYSLKRTDDGSETILAYESIIVERATQT